MEEKLHWVGEQGAEMLTEAEIKDIDHEIQRLPSGTDLPPLVQPLVRKVEQMVTRVAYQEVDALAAELKREARSLALELGKPIPQLVFEGEGILLSRQAESLLRSALLHLVRNSLDHGLESSEERRILGKNLEGLIRLTFESRDDRLRMRYTDDGRGLNFEAIQRRAISLGMLSAEENVLPEKLTELIFESGFSTKSKADMISGRGVGMDAVRHLFEDAGGRIWIEGTGTGSSAFVIIGELPAALCRLMSTMQKGA
jgi:chemotaxis protein histidine kinase CheA